MKYKAVIFDLDGTLVHTTPEYRYKVVPQTLTEFGVIASKENIDKFWFGHPDREIVIRDHFGVAPELFWKEFRKNDDINLRIKESRTYPDIDFLAELKEKGYKLGIVTGAPEHIAYPEIKLIGEDNFDSIILAHEFKGIRSKPDPQGLFECLKILKLRPEEVIFVGNGDEDILAAKNAGIFDVLLLRGEHDFIKQAPSVFINSLYELRKILAD